MKAKNPFLEFFAEIGIMNMCKPKHKDKWCVNKFFMQQERMLEEFRKGNIQYRFANGTKYSR